MSDDGGDTGGGGGTDNPAFNNDEETSCNNSTSTASFGKHEGNEVRIEVPEDPKKNGELSFLNSSNGNANNAPAQTNNGKISDSDVLGNAYIFSLWLMIICRNQQ